MLLCASLLLSQSSTSMSEESVSLPSPLDSSPELFLAWLVSSLSLPLSFSLSPSPSSLRVATSCVNRYRRSQSTGTWGVAQSGGLERWVVYLNFRDLWFHRFGTKKLNNLKLFSYIIHKKKSTVFNFKLTLRFEYKNMYFKNYLKTGSKNLLNLTCT